jgi:Sulfotransferase family
VSALRSAPAPSDVIVLNCYGRGGSSIVWRMIGSSPDVIMTTKEWHVGVFGEWKKLRKGLIVAFKSLGIRSAEPLRRYALGKMIEMQHPRDVSTKPVAHFVVIKLMDHHIIFAEMIARSFQRAKFINLTRHPYGQCESLMRSGLSLDSACRWYNDVACMMADHAQAGALSLRFEDIVTRPMETCDTLYRFLGVRWAEDGKFDFKAKPYGAERLADVGVHDGELIRIGGEDAEHHIDASVLRAERERLSDAQRREIWQLAGTAANRLGYTAFGSS